MDPYEEDSWGVPPESEAGAKDLGVVYVPDFREVLDPGQFTLVSDRDAPMRGLIRAWKLRYEVETDSAIEKGRNVIITLNGERWLVGAKGWRRL